MELNYFTYDLKLKYPFSISRHTYFSQPSVVIELSHNGRIGYGEATANPYYHIDTKGLCQSFDSMKSRLQDYTFEHPDQLYDDFTDFLEINSFALAALNNASWDLYGKIQHQSVSDLLDLSAGDRPLTSYTLGISSTDEIIKKLADHPWPLYKIKVGSDHDFEILDLVRERSGAVLRVDANCAWTKEQTLSNSKKLREYNVEFIEQPLPYNDPEQRDVFQGSRLPLIADESCRTETDVESCAALFHGINIKLLKCGGLSPALRMVDQARKLGMKVMIGCMTESSVGISAAAQLLPLVDYADLDGPLLLAEDLAVGIHYDYGKITLDEGFGFGIQFRGK